MSPQFAALPDVLIQDPASGAAFFVTATQLQAKHKFDADDLQRVNGGTVTFVVPDEDFLQDAPPFKASPEVETSVLIQYPTGKSSFFLSLEELEEYTCAGPMEYGSYGISFVLPVGLEHIETLPISIVAALQSGESGVINPVQLREGSKTGALEGPLDWARARK